MTYGEVNELGENSEEIGVTEKLTKYNALTVEGIILTVRGQKVILDVDLARIYGVETRVLNQAVKRNREKFPADFAFLLTNKEVMALRSQIVISNHQPKGSQSATGSRRGGRRHTPTVFTEHGAIMAATVLNSLQAVKMSVFVVRAFIKMREQLLNRAELEKRLVEIEKVLLSHDTALRDLYQKIKPLLLPPTGRPRRQIGFDVREKRN